MTSLIFNNMKDNSFISAKEQQSAEIARLKQQRLFDKQFSAIARKARKRLTDQLGPYENNGILRCAGRYKNLPLSEVQIARHGQLARLIINEAHLKVMRVGLQATPTEV